MKTISFVSKMITDVHSTMHSATRALRFLIAGTRAKLSRENFTLVFFVIGSFVGIWHALPLLTVTFDEQYFVGGVLRAIEMKSLLPPAGEVPYGTVTLYLNYVLQAPFLSLLLAWKSFSVASLKTYLVLHPETAYLVPRFLSAFIMSIVAITYNRFLRREGLSLIHRFAVLSVIFCTIIATATLHTGKMWVLTFVLAAISALCTYIALKNHAEKRHEPMCGAIFWGIITAFAALANFLFAAIFLINIPIFLFAFRNDAIRFRTTIRAICAGVLVFAAVLATNFQSIWSLATAVLNGGDTYHKIPFGEGLARTTDLYFASLVLHVEQVLVAFPLIVAVIAIAAPSRSVQNKLLFRLSALYGCLYFAAIVVISPWLTDIGSALHYIYPLAFFFAGALASVAYHKMRSVIWVFCGLQTLVFVYTLYLLSVPTTFNQVATYVDTNFKHEHVLIQNEVHQLSFPLNKETSLLLGENLCGSKCLYWRSSAQDSDFVPVVVTLHSQIEKMNMSSYSRVFLITDTFPAESCAPRLVAAFQSGSSDTGFISHEYNLGKYLFTDYWHLSRLGENIRLYEVSPKCAASLPS